MVKITRNTVADPERREMVANAVTAGIGTSAKDGDWEVRIFEPQDSPRWEAKIIAPTGREYDLAFEGPDEQHSSSIVERVRSTLAD